MIKQLLLAPGPTPVPARVRLAMAHADVSPSHPAVQRALRRGARSACAQLFQTEEDVLVLASSGTGAMEAAVTNCFDPGDEVVVVNGGKFGERWGKLADTFGLKPIEIRVRVGTRRPARSGRSRPSKSTRAPAACSCRPARPRRRPCIPIEQIAAVTQRARCAAGRGRHHRGRRVRHSRWTAGASTC